MGGFGDGAGSSANSWEQVVLVVCRGTSAGRVEGGAVRWRGRVVGEPFARGRGDVQWMPPCWTQVVSWQLEARVGGEGVYGDEGALIRDVEVVLVAARVVGDDDVGRRCVVVECGIGELFGDLCRRVPHFRRSVMGHEEVDGPPIVSREVEVW